MSLNRFISGAKEDFQCYRIVTCGLTVCYEDLPGLLVLSRNKKPLWIQGSFGNKSLFETLNIYFPRSDHSRTKGAFIVRFGRHAYIKMRTIISAVQGKPDKFCLKMGKTKNGMDCKEPIAILPAD